MAAAPTIDSVSAGDGSLDVAWTASTGTVATAYDLRYIRTDAGDKADANWTVEEDVWTSGTGSLDHTVVRLTNGVQYDVQVRAVAGSVDGTWSATSTGTPVDHGGTRFTATAIDLNASVVGTIHSASDDDYFRITLAEASGVFIYTTSYITGFLQTTGDLWNSGGTVIKERRPGRRVQTVRLSALPVAHARRGDLLRAGSAPLRRGRTRCTPRR